MLIHADHTSNKAIAIKGDAHIVLSIETNGRITLESYRLGRWHSLYAESTDAVVSQIPKLLAELLQELGEFARTKAARQSPQ